MRRGFEQESRYTLSKHAKEFKNKVRVLIENDEERSAFFTALTSYQQSNSVPKLVGDLRSVINTPKRYPLFREVGFLIKPPDVLSYYNLIPKSPSDGIRLIRLQHFGNGGIGFSIRGGREHRVGIFVSLVARGSQADIVGLRAGDEILSINGLYLAEATHEEVVNILRSCKNMLLKVRATGKVPYKIHDVISWETAEGKENVYYHPDLLDYLIKEGDFLNDAHFEAAPDDKKVTLIVGSKGIGCSVRNGIPGKEGLFVISVTSGSLADKTGVRIGDQIVAVNGKNIMKLRYSEAVFLLKSFRELHLVLRHSKEAEVFIMAEIAKQQEDKVPEFAVKTQLLKRKAEEKEKLEKAKEQMHFQQLKDDCRMRDESIEAISRTGTETSDEGTNAFLPSSEKQQPPLEEVTLDNHKTTGLSNNIQSVILGPSTSQHNETVLVEIHPTPAKINNPKDDVLEGREVHFLTIEKVLELGLELEERNDGIFVKDVLEHGSVAAHGGVQLGDQLLNVDGTSLLGLSVEHAQEELNKAMNRETENVDLVVAVSKENCKCRGILRSGSVVRKRDPVSGKEVYDTWL